MADPQAPDNDFWRRAFFANHQAALGLSRQKHDVTALSPTEFGAKGDLWLRRFFRAVPIDANPGDRMTVWKDGVVVHEIPLIQMGQETVIGRHPSADLELEPYKLAMFHVVILQRGGKFYVEALDLENGALLARKKMKPNMAVRLHDGSQVDLPGFRLEFTIANSPPPAKGAVFEAEELDEIPNFSMRRPHRPPAPYWST